MVVCLASHAFLFNLFLRRPWIIITNSIQTYLATPPSGSSISVTRGLINSGAFFTAIVVVLGVVSSNGAGFSGVVSSFGAGFSSSTKIVVASVDVVEISDGSSASTKDREVQF